MDASGRLHYTLMGTWDERMECATVSSSSNSENGGGERAPESKTLLWRRNPLPYVYIQCTLLGPYSLDYGYLEIKEHQSFCSTQ